MERCLVSFIVPVYNIEEKLRICIESILNQSYENLELILVDDGSTDRSGKICDEYKEQDDRVKVLHKANGGVSRARNAGMELISGEWFAFCDADDYYEVDFLKNALSQVKSDTALYFCGISMDYCQNNTVVKSDHYTVSKTVGG